MTDTDALIAEWREAKAEGLAALYAQRDALLKTREAAAVCKIAHVERLDAMQREIDALERQIAAGDALDARGVDRAAWDAATP